VGQGGGAALGRLDEREAGGHELTLDP
jgi:hypothetical protein